MIDVEYLKNELQEFEAGKREAGDIVTLLYNQLVQSMFDYNELMKESNENVKKQTKLLDENIMLWRENERLLRQNTEYQETQNLDYPFVPALLYRLDKQQETLDSLESAVIGLEVKLDCLKRGNDEE